MDNDQDSDGVHDALIPVSSVNHKDHIADRKENSVAGMILIAIGSFIFCTIAAVIKYFDGSVTQLMIGRYMIQYLIGWFVWYLFKKYNNFFKTHMLDVSIIFEYITVVWQ